ncbi:methyl-accepting chemotaxis protein [Pseudomonas sp. UL073]|uniref:Methyl-accepting chemotaxis protein n=1 Tax=Zestomonas insulae TaxID=2809017 RepID=A0ABS2IJ36_9GAMM|nr:methyl-accepting chemotaxis protein [Pseudomonas insulae]MBM7062339.1 methyl-accepting chemotaxis protein [Pseudomonas insulae]
MPSQSLHSKLFVTAQLGAALVLSLLLAFVAFAGYKMATGNAAKYVERTVEVNARQVEAELDKAWSVAASLTDAALALQSQHAERTQTDAVTRRMLESNPQLLGLGHYWHANTYDGNDAAHVGQPGSDADGRYMSHWSRTTGAVQADTTTAHQDYRPPRSNQAWVSEPYRRTTTGGQPEMLLSIMLPLQQGGQALGVTAVDLPLQAITRQLAQIDVYGGYAALISTAGHYASHPDTQRLGQLADDLPAEAMHAIEAGQPYSFNRDGQAYRLQPVRIGNTANPWALLVSYSQEAAQAQIYKLITITISLGVTALLLMAALLWFLLAWQIRPLVGLANGIQGWQGELSLRFEQRGRDETGKLAGAFNQFIQRLSDLVGSIRHSSGTLMNVSQHLDHTTRAVAERSSAQHTATEEMAGGVTALAQSVTEMAQQAEEVEHLARNTEALTSRIARDMGQTVGEIGHVNQTMGAVADSVGRLEERSQQIAGIVDVIRSIAEQTNLLALNAAIEAARAGEQGRGFAVVADEVRSLAERTSRSTREIGEMIGAIGSDISQTVDDVQQVGQAMHQGVEQLSASAAGVEQIRQHAQDILARISEVARQTQGQSATGEQLSISIQGVRGISEQNDQAIRGLLDQSNQLRDQANSLSQQLGQFRH